VNFDEVAREYSRVAIVQKNAGIRLIELLRIGEKDDVLDAGCGNGALTAVIREITKGRIVGIDSSRKMIEEAKKRVKGVEFYVMRVEDLEFENEFDIIFSNSSFQWFDADRALERFKACLRDGGKVGVQAPARKDYSPTFLRAVEAVRNSEIGKIFKHFRSPWFFLDSEEEYIKLFERHGFEVEHCRIEKVVTRHTPEELLKIFNSGAVAAYLNPKFYEKADGVDEAYRRKFLEIVRREFENMAINGLVELVFYRVYILAVIFK